MHALKVKETVAESLTSPSGTSDRRWRTLRGLIPAAGSNAWAPETITCWVFRRPSPRAAGGDLTMHRQPPPAIAWTPPTGAPDRASTRGLRGAAGPQDVPRMETVPGARGYAPTAARPRAAHSALARLSYGLVVSAIFVGLFTRQAVAGSLTKSTVYKRVREEEEAVRLQKFTYRVVQVKQPSKELENPIVFRQTLEKQYRGLPESLTPAERSADEDWLREMLTRARDGYTRVVRTSYSFRRRKGDLRPDALRVEDKVLVPEYKSEARHVINLFDGRQTYLIYPETKGAVVRDGNQIDRRSLAEEVMLLGGPLESLMQNASTRVSAGPRGTVLLSGPLALLGYPPVRINLDPNKGFGIAGLELGDKERAKVTSWIQRAGRWIPSVILHDVKGVYHIVYNLESATVEAR
jgi:hypothetical protein